MVNVQADSTSNAGAAAGTAAIAWSLLRILCAHAHMQRHKRSASAADHSYARLTLQTGDTSHMRLSLQVSRRAHIV